MCVYVYLYACLYQTHHQYSCARLTTYTCTICAKITWIAFLAFLLIGHLSSWQTEPHKRYKEICFDSIQLPQLTHIFFSFDFILSTIQMLQLENREKGPWYASFCESTTIKFNCDAEMNVFWFEHRF